MISIHAFILDMCGLYMNIQCVNVFHSYLFCAYITTYLAYHCLNISHFTQMLLALHRKKIYILNTYKQMSTCIAVGHAHILLGPKYEHELNHLV